MRLVTACLLVGILAYSVAADSFCRPSEFDCGGIHFRKCVPKTALCNHIEECANGSDERNCTYVHPCEANMLSCRNGECIDLKFKCDGNIDCDDGSDEEDCQKQNDLSLKSKNPVIWSDAPECPKNRFKCRGEGHCIDITNVCNGYKDCPYGDDEVNCPQINSDKNEIICYNERMCADGSRCVPFKDFCDGKDDCSDGSDEVNCHVKEEIDVQRNDRLCSVKEYRCRGEKGNCIPLNKTCNHESDCDNKDDEGELCSHCPHLGCQFGCEKSTNSSENVCKCPAGSRLSDDGLSCESLHKPSRSRCNHFGKSIRGKMYCSCYPGYKLATDKYTCIIDTSIDGRILIGVGNEIRSMPLFDQQSSEGYTLKATVGTHGFISSLDYLANSDEIFVGVKRGARYGELGVLKNGTLRIIRENVTGLQYIAVDWISRNIYFTQNYYARTPGISVCSLDGIFCKKIVQGIRTDPNERVKVQSYGGLTLCPQQGLMFWIDTFSDFHRIMYSKLDGSDVNVLTSKVESPIGLAYDPTENDLYIGDKEKFIEKINFVTRERFVVMARGVIHPYQILFFDSKLYWLDHGNNQVVRGVLNKQVPTSTPLHVFRSHPKGLTINHTYYQPELSNKTCNSSNCPWICVNIFDGHEQSEASCVCPTGYKKQGDECVTSHVFRDTESHPSYMVMKEMCSFGLTCFNGGICEEDVVDNVHKRIVCSCQGLYEGDRCEHYIGPGIKKKGVKAIKDKETPMSPWMHFVYLLVFISLTTCFVIIIYSYIDDVRNFAKFSLAQLNYFDFSSIKNVSPFLRSHMPAMTTIMNPLTPFHANTVRVEFDNPLFNRNNADRYDIPGEVVIGDTTTESSQMSSSFSNPYYSEVPITTASVSDFEVSYNHKFAY